jgi:hypothetical protein
MYIRLFHISSNLNITGKFDKALKYLFTFCNLQWNMTCGRFMMINLIFLSLRSKKMFCSKEYRTYISHQASKIIQTHWLAMKKTAPQWTSAFHFKIPWDQALKWLGRFLRSVGMNVNSYKWTYCQQQSHCRPQKHQCQGENKTIRSHIQQCGNVNPRRSTNLLLHVGNDDKIKLSWWEDVPEKTGIHSTKMS